MSAADRLRGDRVATAHGHLSLDREKAREKLRLFRLPDPHFYVLQFVRAASVLGAKRIDFEISASEVTCSFVGTLDEELLKDIWGVAFERRADATAQAVHYVALGIGSAQALNPAFIDVHSGDVALRIDQGGEALAKRKTGVGTVIRVKEKFRFGHFFEFLQSIRGTLAEARALELHCELSPMEVRVNGISNRTLGGECPQTFETEHERGFVALEALSVDGWCRLFKDGVLLEKVAVPNHGRAAIAVLESTRVQTDLSGLALIKSDGWDTPLHEVVLPHYHAALLEWSQSQGIEVIAERLDMVAEVCTYLTKRHGAPAAQTRQLLDHLQKQPLFPSALEIDARKITMADASTVAVLRVAKERFPNVRLPDTDVLLVEPYADAGPHDARMRMLRESAIHALTRSGVRNVIDYTAELERRSMAKRNKALWQAREPRELGGHRYQRAASIGPRRGFVYLPLDGPGDPVSEDERGYFAFREARLLRHQPGQLTIGMEFDGQLGVDSAFSDLIRDQRFGKLAAMLCGQSLSLHQELARDLIEAGVDERRRPRILDEFVLALHRGEWCMQFMSDAGYSLDVQARDVIDEHTGLLADLLWFGQSRPRDEFIERLGPIAQVPSFELADGSRCSLAEALRNPDLCLLKPTGDWRTFLSTTRTSLSPEVLANIAIADEAQRNLLLGLRAIPDARMVVDRLLARSKFFARPAYVFEKPANVALDEAKSSNWFDYHVMLIPSGEEGICITTLVWQGRVLGHRRFAVPMGSFEAVVWSDEFQPTAHFDNAQNDQRVSEVHHFLINKSNELIDRWWTAQCRNNTPGRGAEFDLFVDVAWALAEDHPEREILPVIVRENDKWTPRLASRVQLRSAIARSGLVLSYTRGLAADPSLLADPTAPVARLGSKHEPAMLNEVLGHEMRFVDATKIGTATRVPPRQFWDKPARPMEIEGAAVEWKGTIRGIACHCGLYHHPGQVVSTQARIDVLTATAAELQELHGIGPNLASSIILLRGHGGITKPEDLLRVPGIGPTVFDRIKTSITVGEAPQASRTSNLVDVLVQRRKLESLDVQTPMGKFRTTMTGGPIVPDPTYKFAAGGRDKILLAAHATAANTIRAACEKAHEDGAPPHEIVEDLRRFLLICKMEQPRSPFDLEETLQSTPLFPTLSGNWLAFAWLPGFAHDKVLYWSTEGNRDDVLRLSDEEIPLLEALLGDELTLQFVESAWLPSSEASTQAAAHIEGDPILDTVVDLLLAARGDRSDLFDDELARSVRWVPLQRELCRVSASKVDVNPEHPLARKVVEQSDIASCVFLASSVYSAINAYYREITDHDELELQARLVRSLER